MAITTWYIKNDKMYAQSQSPFHKLDTDLGSAFFFVVHMWLTVRMVRLHTAPPLFLTQFWMLLTLLPRMRMVRTLFHWLIVLCNFYMFSTVCLHHPTHSLAILSISSSIIVTSTSCPPPFHYCPCPLPILSQARVTHSVV